MPVIDHPPLKLQASTGQPLVIALAAMPGAGAMWQAPAAPPGCSLTESATQESGPGTGGPAMQQFVLTCDRPGELQLRFEFKRPWEAALRAVQAVVVNVG
jgi:inhibitor of cysteine peptidase